MMTRTVCAAGTVLLAVGFQASTSGAIYYVDNHAPSPGGNGLSWSAAFNNLQQALGKSIFGDEIRMAQGTYKSAEPGAARTNSFILVAGVTLRGGYAGVTGADPDARDIAG